MVRHTKSRETGHADARSAPLPGNFWPGQATAVQRPTKGARSAPLPGDFRPGQATAATGAAGTFASVFDS